MTKQAVGTMYELFHESQMPRGHVEISLFTRDLAGFRKYREIHEYGVAHFSVERHGIFHFAGIRKAECRRFAHELDVTCITGSLSQFTEHQVSGQNQRARAPKAVLGTNRIGFREANDVSSLAETKPGNERQSGNVSNLV